MEPNPPACICPVEDVPTQAPGVWNVVVPSEGRKSAAAYSRFLEFDFDAIVFQNVRSEGHYR